MLIYNDWLLQKMVQQHYQDLLREAEKSRLARLVLSARTLVKKKKKTAPQAKAPCKPVQAPCCQTAL